MKHLLLLIGPTLMIVIGLTIFGNIPLTFILFYGWLLLVPLLSKRNSSRSLFSQIPNKKSVVIVGLISGIVSCVVILSTMTYLFDYIVDLISLQRIVKEWGFTGIQLIWLVLVLIVINPILEELYWREFMYRRLHQSLGVKGSILLTSLFYSLYHLLSVIPMFTWPLNLISVLPVLLAGVLWGYFRYKLNNIMTSIISHALADLGIILVYFLHVF
ncbi:CPBP family intramembrane glutamic endopeptidase [Bacillus sp. DJP31]|uniref:CPBP family intramembrane glutamic endopeptidase n=1 Tax=Bacillus sp. DJP31 TaxID=3409789 RepID=UPI003BB5573A